MAVVGGLVLAISTKRNQNNPEQSFSKKIIPHCRFNAGRLIGFSVLGGILGIIGQAISLSPLMMSVMMFIVGIVLLLLGIHLSKLFPKLSAISLPFTKIPNKKNATRWQSTFLSGAATFFLPCGFTFAMQRYAMSTGSFFSGALVMFLFALGTLP